MFADNNWQDFRPFSISGIRPDIRKSNPVSGRKSKKGQITGIHISTVDFVLHCVLVVPLLVLGQLPLPFHFAAFNLPVPELIYQSVQESPGSQLKGGVQ
jgi:hypothetical protein